MIFDDFVVELSVSVTVAIALLPAQKLAAYVNDAYNVREFDDDDHRAFFFQIH